MDYENAHQLGRLILKLANTLIKNRNRHLKALDLTTSQADSLQFFLANPQSTVTDLKAYLEITPSNGPWSCAKDRRKRIGHSLPFFDRWKVPYHFSHGKRNGAWQNNGT